MAVVTPIIQTARAQYAANLAAINGTGDYNYKATIRQGEVDPLEVLGLGEGEALLYMVRTTVNSQVRFLGPHRRRMLVTFVVRGYVYAADGERGEIERLEHDVWRATVDGSSLAATADQPYIESVEFGEEEIRSSPESDDIVTTGFVEINLSCSVVEDV